MKDLFKKPEIEVTFHVPGKKELKINGKTPNYKGLAIGCAIAWLIMLVWYILEWYQFGELQQNRTCDSVVSILYWFALMIGFSKW